MNAESIEKMDKARQFAQKRGLEAISDSANKSKEMVRLASHFLTPLTLPTMSVGIIAATIAVAAATPGGEDALISNTHTTPSILGEHVGPGSFDSQ